MGSHSKAVYTDAAMDEPSPPRVADILRGSEYALTLFSPEDIESIPLFWRSSRPYVRCLASDRNRAAKPEEIVRQLWLRRLMSVYGYAKDRIAVERPVFFGSAVHMK